MRLTNAASPLMNNETNTTTTNATVLDCVNPAEYWSHHLDQWPTASSPGTLLCDVTWVRLLRETLPPLPPPPPSPPQASLFNLGVSTSIISQRASRLTCVLLMREWVTLRLNELASIERHTVWSSSQLNQSVLLRTVSPLPIEMIEIDDEALFYVDRCCAIITASSMQSLSQEENVLIHDLIMLLLTFNNGLENETSKNSSFIWPRCHPSPQPTPLPPSSNDPSNEERNSFYERFFYGPSARNWTLTTPGLAVTLTLLACCMIILIGTPFLAKYLWWRRRRQQH